MRLMYCGRCEERTPHKYAGRENDFEEDGALVRAMATIFTLGMSEFCNSNYYYKCRCCGKIKIVEAD